MNGRMGKGAKRRAHVLIVGTVVRVGFATLSPPYKNCLLPGRNRDPGEDEPVADGVKKLEALA